MATPPPPPLPELPQAHQALASLGAALHICAGFARRNKNQHAASRWWAQLAMLRRHARRLHDDLGDLAERLEARQKPVKKKKTTLQPQPPVVPFKEVARLGEAVLARARWLRVECLPRTYLAFSQLSADNQYAALGLLLLGVLAQVHAALSLLLAADDEEAEPSPPPVEDVPAQAAAPPSLQQEKAPPGNQVVDLGVAISRQDLNADLGVPLPRDQQPSVAVVSKKAKGGNKSRVLSSSLSSSSSARPDTKAGVDEEQQLLGTAKRARGSADDGERSKDKTAKKKKKRKKDDEFGDLFSSLL